MVCWLTEVVWLKMREDPRFMKCETGEEMWVKGGAGR
jgi:hypothetical protein